MTIDNCVIDMDWRGITIHVAYVIRKEKNKYLLDVISPYEALYCSVFGVQADTLSYSQDGDRKSTRLNSSHSTSSRMPSSA